MTASLSQDWSKAGITALVLITTFFVLAQPAAAMKPTKAAMVELSDTHTAYMLTYQFGFLNRSLVMPGEGVRHGSPLYGATTTPPLTYTLRDKDGNEATSGLTLGTVLGTTPKVDGTFSLPDSKNGEFTLLVIHAHSATDTATYLTIDNLPFTLTDRTGSSTLSTLQSADMARFTTKSITESSFIRYPLE
jgi:hypothetical protein